MLSGVDLSSFSAMAQTEVRRKRGYPANEGLIRAFGVALRAWIERNGADASVATPWKRVLPPAASELAGPDPLCIEDRS